MKRFPLISLALLVILLSLIGCKESPNKVPDEQGNETTETIIYDAYSKGLSSPFESGEDTTGITLTVTLDNDNKFKDVNVGDEVTNWFENTLIYGIKAEVVDVNSSIASRSTENYITSITIGFSGTPKSAPQKISITIPADKLVGRDKPVGVVIEGQTYTVQFKILGVDGNEYLTQKVAAGKKVTKPDTVKVHYLVDEWKINGNIFDFDTVITKDLDVQGSGKAVRIVTFEYYDGKPNKEVVVVKGQKVPQPTDSSRSGYNFVGWFFKDAEFSFDNQINSDITLKGKWVNANGKATINWYVGNKKINSTTVSQGTLINPIQDPNDHKESVADTFKCWTTDTTTNNPFDFTKHKALEDINLYAVWNELNIGDTYTLKGEYIGSDEGLKTNGIELVILGKRGVRTAATNWHGLPSDYPYKYIAVDKNHDLSYYLFGSDYYNYYRWPEEKFSVWANTNYETGGNGDDIGDGYSNTKKALACGSNLFTRDNSSENKTLWNYFLLFTEKNIDPKYRDKWFVPSIEEVIQIVRFEYDSYGPDIKNLTNESNCNPCYWSSTETNIPIRVANSPGAPEKDAKYVKYYQLEGHFRMTVFTSLKSPTTHGYYYRTRLCRVL